VSNGSINAVEIKRLLGKARKHGRKGFLDVKYGTYVKTNLLSGQTLTTRGSFNVKQAKIKQKCHPGSKISKLIFFVDSAFGSKKKSHITFFSKTSPFWSRPF
jgi:hypothetical protein